MNDCQVAKVKRGTSGTIKCQVCGKEHKYEELRTSDIVRCECGKVTLYLIPKD